MRNLHTIKVTNYTTYKLRSSPLVKMIKLVKMILELGRKKTYEKKLPCLSTTTSKRISISGKRPNMFPLSTQ